MRYCKRYWLIGIAALGIAPAVFAQKSHTAVWNPKVHEISGIKKHLKFG